MTEELSTPVDFLSLPLAFPQVSILSYDLIPSILFQDLPNAMNAAEITDKLGLHSLRNRNWYIQVRIFYDRTSLFPLGYKGRRICFEIRAKADTSLEANIVIVYYLAIIFFLYLQLLAVANMYFLFKASVQLQMISVASIVSTRKKQIIYLIFRLHVPPLAKDFTKAWIGCQTSWRMPIAKK